jgi:hypothetical protein
MLDGIDVAVVIWLALAALSGVGEMLSGTMFLLPIVAGAIVAAALAAFGCGSDAQPDARVVSAESHDGRSRIPEGTDRPHPRRAEASNGKLDAGRDPLRSPRFAVNTSPATLAHPAGFCWLVSSPVSIVWQATDEVPSSGIVALLGILWRMLRVVRLLARRVWCVTMSSGAPSSDTPPLCP